MEGFMGYVSHDTALYRVERQTNGCKVIIYERPCRSCEEKKGWYEHTEETFCTGMYGTFRCCDCSVCLEDEEE